MGNAPGFRVQSFQVFPIEFAVSRITSPKVGHASSLPTPLTNRPNELFPSLMGGVRHNEQKASGVQSVPSFMASSTPSCQHHTQKATRAFFMLPVPHPFRLFFLQVLPFNFFFNVQGQTRPIRPSLIMSSLPLLLKERARAVTVGYSVFRQ